MKTDPLTIALIIFAVVVLSIYYYRQFAKWSAQQKNITWPKKIENCPDYWNETKTGTCENVLNLPTGDCGTENQPLKNFQFKNIV